MRFKDISWRGNGGDMTRIRDRIALMGQGVIADRTIENLGEADIAIKLLRLSFSMMLVRAQGQSSRTLLTFTISRDDVDFFWCAV